MKMPAQTPGLSEQTVCTPRDFLSAVELRFGRLDWDLAATAENEVTGRGRFFGPGSPHAEDALASGVENGPGFRPGFARMARIQKDQGTELAMLIPASVATNWFAEEVHGHALVLPLRPRLTFVGHKDPYPKDLMLCVYGRGVGFEPWAWK